MASGGFAGSTFGDQIERVYRNVMSNQREFVAQLQMPAPATQYSTGGSTLYIQGIQAQSIQIGSLLAIDEEVFLVQNVTAATSAGVTTYTVTVTYGYEGSINTNHLNGAAVYINPKYTRFAIGVALRLATVFGVSPRMRQDLLVNDFVYKAVTDGYLVLFEAHFKRNYIHVQDIAQTFEFVINNYDKCKGQAFNVGLSTANLSKLELAERIRDYVPKLAIKQDEFNKDFDQRNYIVSNAKLEALGWNPAFSLDYGIEQLINAYQMTIVYNNRNFTNL